jgi:LysR family transcriptional activator of nhaA
MPQRVRLVTYEGKFDQLLGELALHQVDVVLAESPLPPSTSVRAFNHPLGSCTTTLLGARALAEKYRPGFPRSLAGAPLVLPTQNTLLRRALEQWLDTVNVRPDVLHEIEDSALLKVFGQAGLGMFPVPTAIAESVCAQFHVELVGEIAAVKQRYFAITAERRLQHPAVVAIANAARSELFVREGPPAAQPPPPSS